jgi:purine nucleoside permease
MPDDPVSRLRLVQEEVDKIFGSDYARQHPEVTAAALMAASIDFATVHIVEALREIAAALVEDVPAAVEPWPRHGLLRPR